MSEELSAIYEGGVFRPLTPVNLPESAQVSIVVRSSGSDKSPPIELQRQREALDAMFAVVDKLPQVPHHDGLSNRDHDQILYGAVRQ